MLSEASEEASELCSSSRQQECLVRQIEWQVVGSVLEAWKTSCWQVETAFGSSLPTQEVCASIGDREISRRQASWSTPVWHL